MSTADSPKTFRLAVPSIPDRITEVDEFVESVLRDAGVAEETIADIAIAVTETVNNAITHGNSRDPRKAVTLTVVFEAGQVRMDVADEGQGFDPSRVADPLARENLLREVGRGIFIIRHLMDTVEIDSAPGGGTTVRMTKKLGAPSAP